MTSTSTWTNGSAKIVLEVTGKDYKEWSDEVEKWNHFLEMFDFRREE